MFSEKIQYNAPIPGEEYKTRDLAVPAEAARVVYEVDSQHGEDKNLCLTIFSRVFRGSDAVLKTLHECSKVFEGRDEGSTTWRFQATVNRNIRVTTIETKMASIKDELKNLLVEYRKKQKIPMTGLLKKEMEKKYLEAKEEAEAERDILVKEISFYKADLKNTHFTKEEEAKAKEEVLTRREEEGSEGNWESWLEKILTAILKTPTQQVTRRKMEIIATSAIESLVRGGSSLIEYATELDKALRFARWQAKIFVKGEMLPEIINRYEGTAYATFYKSLKLVEKASWNFIDDEEERPLKKVLARLRSGVSVQVAPTMVVRAGRRKVEEEEDAEEEREGEEAPKRKKGKALDVAVAQVEAPVDPVVAALIGKIDTLVSTIGKGAQGGAVNPERRRSFAGQGVEWWRGCEEGEEFWKFSGGSWKFSRGVFSRGSWQF